MESEGVAGLWEQEKREREEVEKMKETKAERMYEKDLSGGNRETSAVLSLLKYEEEE